MTFTLFGIYGPPGETAARSVHCPLIPDYCPYFLPSFFQKRLLRYALSRLELVDTEALDLDSLGIRWGQRSTVELRDIGLRLDVSATVFQTAVQLLRSAWVSNSQIRHLTFFIAHFH